MITALPAADRRKAVETLGRAAADFPNDIEAEFETAKPRPVFDEWVWVAEASQFIRRSDTQKFDKEQWKSLYTGLKQEGDILSAVWKGTLPLRKFEKLVYLPEDNESPDGEAGARYNIFGDHMLAASFARDGRYRRFLKRVASHIGETSEPLSDVSTGTWKLNELVRSF